MDSCLFTVATGEKYLQFAYTLARSYRFHNDLSIPFVIVSNEDFNLPTDLTWVKKKIISKELMGKGMEYRFNFDEVVPAYQSLFIDADSIIYKNVTPLFEMPNKSMAVIGLKVTDGNWADIDPVDAFKKFDISYLVRYCGAFYYILKNEETKKICETATDLLKSDYPFQQHRHSVNDEPILSVSMTKFGVEPVIDNGNLWTDIGQLKSPEDLNVLKGLATFTNKLDNRNYKFWLPEGPYSPIVLHFGGGIFNKNPWLFDSLRLKLYYQFKLSKTLAEAIVTYIVKPAYFSGKFLNKLFR